MVQMDIVIYTVHKYIKVVPIKILWVPSGVIREIWFLNRLWTHVYKWIIQYPDIAKVTYLSMLPNN